MLILIAVTFLVASMAPMSAPADVDFPEFSDQRKPSCAVLWEIGNYASNRIECNPHFELEARSSDGVVYFGVRNIETSYRPLPARNVLALDVAPKPISDFLKDLRSCGDSSNCLILKDSPEIFNQLVALNEATDIWETNVLGGKAGHTVEFGSVFL
ncbi:hypothetical protein [Ruegeria hyattellae]|uniref:hypothetical protein n=1 Tax=Ruegeria hyattellae TaxID=3233337 RepID=UPI00355B7155